MATGMSRDAMRAHGRMLDQIEACYRQHAPAQIRFCAEQEEAQHYADYINEWERDMPAHSWIGPAGVPMLLRSCKDLL